MQQGLTDDLYTRVDKYRESDEFSEREKLAIEYSERFALDHQRIGTDLIDRMRAEYSDPEIVELAGLVAFCMGVGRVYAVLDIANECPIMR
jgi:alkylhydroperoxidase family enzyme